MTRLGDGRRRASRWRGRSSARPVRPSTTGSTATSTRSTSRTGRSPRGRIPGRWGFYIACLWTALSLALAATLGLWVFLAAAFGLALAWTYSAPPLRLKQNGWWGNSAVAICYEGLPWFTGAAVMAASLPDSRVIALALLYSFGAHGIMTLNDFKSVEGDSQMGVRSLPVQLGVDERGRARLRGDGGPAGRRHRAAARLGASLSMPRRSARCSSDSSR